MDRRTLLVGAVSAIGGVGLRGVTTDALTGSGDASETIDLEPGVLIVEVTHEETLSIEVGTAAETTVLLEEVDSGAAIGGMALEGGTYDLEVTTEGEWHIDLVQPDDEEALSLPVEGEGEGPAWGGPVALEGEVAVIAAHEDQGRFAVTLVGERERITPIEAEDPFAGRAPIDLEGPTYVTVDATGRWWIAIEPREST